MALVGLFRQASRPRLNGGAVNCRSLFSGKPRPFGQDRSPGRLVAGGRRGDTRSAGIQTACR